MPPQPKTGGSLPPSQKFRNKSIWKLPINASEPSGHGAPWPLAGRSCSLEVASFALTLNFSEAPKVLRARFVARTGPLGLDFGSPGRPRTRFWRPKRLDFRLFSACLCVSCQFRSNPTKHCKNWYARHIGAFARQDKSDRKSIRGRVRSRSVQRWRSDGSLGGSWSVFGAARGPFWTALGRSWLARAAPRSAWRRHLGVQWPSRARPDASPKRPWAPKTPQDRFFVDFRSIKDGFSWIFEGLLVDFRSSRVRRRHKSGISKRRRVILSARLSSCVLQSLRTARTSFEMTFKHCVFSFFSVRTHKLT